MPVCTEKEAYTQVYSQGDMECLYREGSLHTCVQSGDGVPVCTQKEAYTQVYSQGDMESEKEAYTQVYSQGDMECLSVLRRKPTHRCIVRVQSG